MLRSLLILALVSPLWACGAEDTAPADETADTGRDRPTGDTGARDAGSSDDDDASNPEPDATPDAAPDAAPTDSGRPDSSEPDAGAPDAAPTDSGRPDTGTDELASVTRLRDQRDAWITNYCNCYGPADFGTFTACRDAQERQWDPGLSACEQTVFESEGAAGEAFVTCITETFLIAETSCIDCPARGSIEFDLCSDPSFDIQFCFNEASPSVQDALIACGG